MKIGSLFDGSGGFPLAASMCGIEPVWASEVEPYPIAVTRRHFPGMKHLGDVSRVNGGMIDPVDVITFGSPCQDMSMAGKRKGIQHKEHGAEETTRSGLFYEAVRIIEEMREATNGVYPAFAVWENVFGAFSSNKGEDFRAVLQALIQIVEPGAVVPPVPKGGWAYADCWMGEGWSIGWRTFDAQYWGVPQRRRRVYLVLDLRGQRAGKILFERPGLRRDFTTGRAKGKGTSADAAEGAGVCDFERRFIGSIRLDNTSGNPYGGSEKSPTIATGTGHGGAANIGVCIQNCLTPWDYQSKRVYGVDGVFPTLNNGETSGQNQQSVLIPTYCIQGNAIDRNAQQNGSGICEDVAFTLNAVDRHGVVETLILDDQGGKQISVKDNGVTPTLRAEMHGHPICVVCAGFPLGFRPENTRLYKETATTLCNGTRSGFCNGVVLCYDARGNGDGKTANTLTGDHENRVTDYTTVICMANENPIVFDKEVYNSGINATGGHYISEGGPAPTLQIDGHPPGVCIYYIVRRLTPTECARLQGFPDRWGDIDKLSPDSPDVVFWREVYRLDCEIKGKKISASILNKPERLAKWHDNLFSDSGEYRMWGNGIALPCALYIMEGIVEAARENFTIS